MPKCRELMPPSSLYLQKGSTCGDPQTGQVTEGNKGSSLLYMAPRGRGPPVQHTYGIPVWGEGLRHFCPRIWVNPGTRLFCGSGALSIAISHWEEQQWAPRAAVAAFALGFLRGFPGASSWLLRHTECSWTRWAFFWSNPAGG